MLRRRPCVSIVHVYEREGRSLQSISLVELFHKGWFLWKALFVEPLLQETSLEEPSLTGPSPAARPSPGPRGRDRVPAAGDAVLQAAAAVPPPRRRRLRPRRQRPPPPRLRAAARAHPTPLRRGEGGLFRNQTKQTRLRILFQSGRFFQRLV